MELNEIQTFFFDLDKTIWNWDETIIGAEDLIDTLREKERNVYFHTDNTLLSREGYARKLNSLGIPTEKDSVLTSGYTLGKHLERENIQKAYVIGESGLIEELEKNDIEVSREAETVVVGLDRQFTYSKLERAINNLSGDNRFYVCSTEKTFRTSKKVRPHQASINSALSQYGEPVNAGKPGEIFKKFFKSYFSYLPGQSLLVGDRLEDIELGNRLGMKTAAVMSGDIDREKIAKAEDIQKPDYGISNLARLKRRII